MNIWRVIGLGILTLSALCLVAWSAVAVLGDPSVEREVQGHEAFMPAVSVAKGVQPEARSSAEAGRGLQVVDAVTQQRVEGANALAVSESKASYREEECALVGCSGADGIVDLTVAQTNVVPRLLVVHPAYQSVCVHLPALGELQRVELEPAGGLRCVVMTGDGMPIEGARLSVAVAGTCWPDERADNAAPLVGVGWDRVWEVSTNAEGVARIGSLPPGRLDYRVEHPDYALVSTRPFLWECKAGEVAEVSATLNPIWGVLVSANVRLHKQLVHVPGGLVLEQSGIEDLGRRAAGFQNQFDGGVICRLYTQECTNGVYSEVPSELQIALLTEEAGWVDAAVPIRERRFLREPYRMAVERPADGNKAGWVEFRLLGLAAESTTREGLMLEPVGANDDPRWHPRQTFVSVGSSQVVPYGRYQVAPVNTFLRRALVERSKIIDVSEGTREVELITDGLTVIRVHVRDGRVAERRLSGLVSVQEVLDGGAAGKYICAPLKGEAIELVVPRGRVRVEVSCAGFPNRAKVVQLADSGVTDVAFDLAEKG